MSACHRRSDCICAPQIIEHYETDLKTNQPIFYKTHFHGRNYTKTGEACFSDDKAKELFPCHMKKKKTSGTLLCLNDRIRFEKKGRSKLFRESALYKDIRYIYLFSNKPEAFMLGIAEDCGPCTYETYTVHSVEDRNKIVELSQLKNPSGKVCNTTCNQVARCNSTSSLDSSVECIRRSVERISCSPDHRRYKTRTVINDYTASVLEPVRTTEYRRSPSPCPSNRYCQKPVYYERVYLEPVQRSPSPIQIHSRSTSRTYVERSPSPDDYVVYRRPPSHEPPTEAYVTPKLRRSVYATNKYNGGETNVTYVNPDPITGTRVTDDGPVYLYVQRRPNGSEHNHPENYGRRRRSASGLSIYR